MISLLFIFGALPQLHLTGSVDGKVVPGWVYARVDQTVELSAQLLHARAKNIQWFSILPLTRATDNTSPSFHWAEIEYRATAIDECEGKVRCAISFAPQGLARLGTRAFQVQVTLEDGRVIATPGLDQKQYGGLDRRVMRVAFRLDDSLIGYATELLQTPYIFGSGGAGERNQSDLLIGSDCADLIVYARRRQTDRQRGSYTSSYALDQQAPPIRKEQVAQVGDVIHFPASRHVGLLFQDLPPVGVVTGDDLILHTCWEWPTVQAIKDSRCSSEPYRVLRFGP
jgi:cell wall-associated NlpC family hydrolase